MNKFNIRKNREKLSEKELQQHMNFDKFMSGYTPIKGMFPKGIKFYSFIASTAVVLGIAGYFVFKAPQKSTSIAVKPFVNPPAPALNVEKSTFAFNTLNDTTLVYSTGTIIHVPSSAFIDDKGNEIKGQVQIKFREFHDQVDVLLSGIPMNYDSAGVSYQLESAGMFEVAAYQNNQPLQLKPGKEIAVNMISHTNNQDNYNIYYLDTVKKQWDYLSANTTRNNTCFPAFEKNTEYEKKIKKAEEKDNVVKPVFPDKADPGAYNFVVNFKNDEFPELCAFNGLKFQPLENKKKLHTQLSEKVWESISIERNADDEKYTVTFSSEKESHAIKVKPVVEGKNYEEQKKEFEKRQRAYEAILEVRRKREIEKKDSLYRLNGVFNGMAKNMDLNERLASAITGDFMGTPKEFLLYRTFSVNRMGIWNSDRTYKFFAGMDRYEVRFLSPKKEELPLKYVYYINRDYNGVYTVDNNSHKIPFSKRIDVVVGVDFDNEIYYLKDEDVSAVDMNESVLHVKMKKADVANIGSLKQLLKM